MHDIEPYYKWRQEYRAETDELSPFYGRKYSEFEYSNKVYNYFIHPQWDAFGSTTLYLKILFTDYGQEYAIIELIGEWNDCLNNDIMYLKSEVIDALQNRGINKFILCCDNVLNFHASDDSYYEEWAEDVMETGGWVVFVNLLKHVEEEMRSAAIQNHVHLLGMEEEFIWQRSKPASLFKYFESGLTKALSQ